MTKGANNTSKGLFLGLQLIKSNFDHLHFSGLQGRLFPLSNPYSVKETPFISRAQLTYSGCLIWAFLQFLRTSQVWPRKWSSYSVQRYRKSLIPRQTCWSGQNRTKIYPKHTNILVIRRRIVSTKRFFNFVVYQCNLPSGRMRPTKERWLALTGKTFHYTSL